VGTLTAGALRTAKIRALKLSSSLRTDSLFLMARSGSITPEELPDYCIYFRWGAFRALLTGRGAMMAWAITLAAIASGFGAFKLLALL
jgi:hypothetical protein